MPRFESTRPTVTVARQVALDHAIRSFGSEVRPDSIIITRAEAFLAFLEGETREES